MSLAEFTAALLTPTALMLLVWGAVRNNRRRRAAEADLARLSGGLLQMLETERSRIARELHDDISQQLAVLALELDALGMPSTDFTRTVGIRIAELAQRVRSIAADIQHVTRGLHPARLEYLGLVPAVRALCQDLEHYGLAIHVSESNWPAELPGATALTLYRVTQEALHNAAKHSGADAVWVRFEAMNSTLKLTVSDAGVGFEPDLMDRIEGFGMMSMRQRLRGVGGSLLVKSAPGQGTRIQATLPRVLSFADAETASSDGRRPSLSLAR